MLNEELIVEIFGEENLIDFSSQKGIIDDKNKKLQELFDIKRRASDVFKVDLSFPDIATSVSAGVLLGIGNALFKNFIPKNGALRHNHGTTRTAVDYGIPKPPGFKGSVNDLHRQIGPGHDIFRFKEALGLMSGKSNDFDLWGKTATGILGHELRPGNLKLNLFRDLGGFKIPTDPKAELINHLLIDFFTKRSLPIPGSSYIADSSPEMAKMMLGMYKNGLNLKTGLGNFIGFSLIQIIIHSYTFLFKAIPQSDFTLKNISFDSAKSLMSSYIELIKKNEFHVMMMMSHGSSFLVDSIITLSSKSYAGLFQLNYLSLMAFSKHLLQYLIKNVSAYNKLIEEAKSKADEISAIDLVWQTNFRTSFEKNFTNPNFQSIFDKDEWLQNSIKTSKFNKIIINNIQREKLLIEQLKE